MNQKNNYKLSKDMSGAERFGTAVGAGIATIYCKCLNASDQAVIDRMRRDGYSDKEIEYYLKTGKTYKQARAEEQARQKKRKEWNEKNGIAGTKRKQKEKKGGFFSKLFGKKEEPEPEKEEKDIKINNGNDYGFSYSINYE